MIFKPIKQIKLTKWHITFQQSKKIQSINYNTEFYFHHINLSTACFRLWGNV